MEALLSRLWLWVGDLSAAIPTLDQASLSLARQRVREVGAALSLSTPVIESMATVTSELAQNQLRHARAGEILVRPLSRDGVAGIEVVAADLGPGIGDATQALRGDHSTAGGLGIGLSGARRLADEMDIDVRLGEGTCVWARKFGGPVRRRREVAVLGTPLGGERVSGDFAGFARLPDALLLVVADGLGHGEAAREAAQRAVTAVLEQPERDPGVLLDVASAAIAAERGMRGAVVAVARWDEAAGRPERVVFAGAGDVMGCLCGEDRAHHFVSRAWVLGRPGPPLSPRAHGDRRAAAGRGLAREEVRASATDALLLASDGLHARSALPAERLRRREPPLVLADHLLRTYARSSDDALVLVAR